MGIEHLEKFMVFLDEKRVAGDIISRAQKIQNLSVNSSYSVNKESADVIKAAEVKQLQEEIRSYTYAVKKTKVAYRFPIFLAVTFNQVLKRKKDGTNSMFGVMDVDNILKATIDSLNKNVIYDDNQIQGILVMRKVNSSDQAYIKIDVFSYDADAVKVMGSGNLESTMDKVFAFTTAFPEGLSPVSYNALYTPTNEGFDLSAQGRQYKNYLAKAYSSTARAYGKMKVGSLLKEDCIAKIDFKIRRSDIRDLDNLLKATIDCLVKTVLFDDRYLTGIFATKTACQPGEPEKLRMEIFKKKPDPNAPIAPPKKTRKKKSS